MTIGLIDIGGTSIKYATYTDGVLNELGHDETPKTLTEFYDLLTAAVSKMKQSQHITGIGISSPGAVDQTTGIIGGASALPYIHGFPIVAELSKRFALPVAIENDANCAALAETAFGAASQFKDVVFLVLGTGVGGSVVLNNRVRHGHHLLGGEFGFMLNEGGHIVSTDATIVNASARYNAATGSHVSGKELYALAEAGEPAAVKQVQGMLYTIAKTIFNIQYSVDPECIVIGGGISANPHLLGDIEKQMDHVMTQVAIADVRPEIRIAKFGNDANLYGAAVNYTQQLGTSL